MSAPRQSSSVSMAVAIPRLYVGLAAVYFLLHAQRTTVNPAWDYSIAMGAALADVGILALFLVIYHIINRTLGLRSSFVLRLNRVFHYALVLIMLMIAWGGQLLFLKAGEALDIHVITFALKHASDLVSVLSSEMDFKVINVLVLCVIPLILISLKLPKSAIYYLRNVAMIAPFAILPACNYLDEDIQKLTYISQVEGVKQSALYSGEYADSINRQIEWVNEQLSHWQRGVLSSLMLGAGFGKLEYMTLARRAGHKEFYRTPVFSAKAGPAPNFIVIILESFRHDIVGAYRGNSEYDNSTYTPFIDSLAKKGVAVETVYTTVPHTSKALVGIFCGTFPEFDSLISESNPNNFSLNCLPSLLKEGGYATSHFQTAPKDFEDRAGLLTNLGFDSYITQENLNSGEWGNVGYLGLDDRALVGPAIHWMKEQKKNGAPFFASLLTITTHHPYSFPGNQRAISSPSEARKSYNKGVRYTDKVVEELFVSLEREGLLENTVVVLTGDHGEAFSEHGQIMHNGVAYEEGMRVPLIFYAPDVLGQRKPVKGLRQHIDLMPTILELAQISYDGVLPGSDLFSVGKGHDEIVTSCFYTDYCLNYYTKDGWKLSYYYGKRNPELYHLVSDRDEVNNLYDSTKKEFVENGLVKAAKLRNSYELIYKDVSEQ